ncbi:MAG TPA: hypothetical protein VFH78_02610 [Candidatus Thermoplasmatota archaeon]|nr:hypothetical protein [Candidatus Thermoplasmatota archaeon]
MRAIFASLLTLTLLSLPLAGASDHGGPGPDAHVRVVGQVVIDDETFYVVEDHGAMQVWRETNGLTTGGVRAWPSGAATGLQPAWTCALEGGQVVYIHEEDACESGVKTAPDQRVTNGWLLHEVEELLPEAAHELVHEIEELLEGTLP